MRRVGNDKSNQEDRDVRSTAVPYIAQNVQFAEPKANGVADPQPPALPVLSFWVFQLDLSSWVNLILNQSTLGAPTGPKTI